VHRVRPSGKRTGTFLALRFGIFLGVVGPDELATGEPIVGVREVSHSHRLLSVTQFTLPCELSAATTLPIVALPVASG
jgi:hypothetical protein